MKVTMCGLSEPVCATLYARKDMLDRKPEEGEGLRGVMWLQGSVASDIEDELDKITADNIFSAKGCEFIKIVRGFNFKNFYDMSALTVSLTNIHIREGYVLDGFYATRGEDHQRMHTYICKENSEWKYEPEFENDVPTTPFQDGQHVDGWVDERILQAIPPMDDFIEMEFAPEAIWDRFLLSMVEHFGANTIETEDDLRVPIFTLRDLARTKKLHLFRHADDERLRPSVHMIGEDSAVISCAYWNEAIGLYSEKMAVMRDGNRFKLGTTHRSMICSAG